MFDSGPTINAHLGAELIVEGEKWPVFVWTIDHPKGRLLGLLALRVSRRSALL
jgi:hypothetical protein